MTRDVLDTRVCTAHLLLSIRKYCMSVQTKISESGQGDNTGKKFLPDRGGLKNLAHISGWNTSIGTA